MTSNNVISKLLRELVNEVVSPRRTKKDRTEGKTDFAVRVWGAFRTWMAKAKTKPTTNIPFHADPTEERKNQQKALFRYINKNSLPVDLAFAAIHELPEKQKAEATRFIADLLDILPVPKPAEVPGMMEVSHILKESGEAVSALSPLFQNDGAINADDPQEDLERADAELTDAIAAFTGVRQTVRNALEKQKQQPTKQLTVVDNKKQEERKAG